MLDEKKLEKIEFPNVRKCPFCNRDACFISLYTDTYKNLIRVNKSESTTPPYDYYQFGVCQHCGKIVVFHFSFEQLGCVGDKKIIFMYPPLAYKNNLPKSINDNYPEFIEIYSQTMRAHEADLHLLTGGGLRRAIECLIEKHITRFQNTQVDKNFSIGQKIELLKGINTNCVKLIKKFGNKESHDDTSVFTFDEALAALDIFCREIDMIYAKRENDIKMDSLALDGKRT